MPNNRNFKLKSGLFALCFFAAFGFAGFTTRTQAIAGTLFPTLTPTATIQHAPCENEATRTPTATRTALPTHDFRTPTLTPTSTAQNLPLFIPLRYPTNCAVLRSGILPAFEFDAPRGPFVTTLTVFSPDTDFYLQLVDYPHVDGTPAPVVLPDGTYYWAVSVSRQSGAGGESETWTFNIDTRCDCTATAPP